MGFNGLEESETIKIEIKSRYLYLHFMKAMTLSEKYAPLISIRT